MDNNEPMDIAFLEASFASIVEPVWSSDSITWEDRNILRQRVTSAVEYLATTRATKEQVQDALESLSHFVSIVTQPPLGTRHGFGVRPSSLDHEEFMNRLRRFLPCPPFCK